MWPRDQLPDHTAAQGHCWLLASLGEGVWDGPAEASAEEGFVVEGCDAGAPGTWHWFPIHPSPPPAHLQCQNLRFKEDPGPGCSVMLGQ